MHLNVKSLMLRGSVDWFSLTVVHPAHLRYRKSVYHALEAGVFAHVHDEHLGLDVRGERRGNFEGHSYALLARRVVREAYVHAFVLQAYLQQYL